MDNATTVENLPKAKNVKVYTQSAFLTLSSKNEKTGNVSVTYASIDGSCPTDCAHRNAGCYAQAGPVAIHAGRLDTYSKTRTRNDAREVARDEAREIRKAITDGNNVRPMRLHVSGDARTNSAAKTLRDACDGWNNPVWSYTHAWKRVARESWGEKISVLASVDKPEDISLAFDRGYAPAIVVEKHDSPKAHFDTTLQAKVIPCPAQTKENVSCVTCKLCWNDDYLREARAVIAFAAHGVQKKKLTVIR